MAQRFLIFNLLHFVSFWYSGLKAKFFLEVFFFNFFPCEEVKHKINSLYILDVQVEPNLKKIKFVMTVLYYLTLYRKSILDINKQLT